MAKKYYSPEIIDLIHKTANEMDTQYKPNPVYDRVLRESRNVEYRNPQVEQKIKTSVSNEFQYSGQEYNGPYSAQVNKYAKQHNINPHLIAGVIGTENASYDPNARSKAGASGLMQLMPTTAKSLGVTNINDPEQNIAAGTKYLATLMKQYNGDVDLALKAYNWGMGNVNAYRQTGKGVKGTAMPSETKAYSSKVLTNYKKLSNGSK